MGRKPFFGYFQLWETYRISKFRILLRRKPPRQRVRVGRYFALFVIIISIPGKAFRQSNSRGYCFPQICYSLDSACSGSWLTAAFIFTYILQCIMVNYTVVTRNAPSRQIKTFYKSKPGQNIHTFIGPIPTTSHVTRQNTFFVPLKWPALRPALFWPDTVANQVSIF